jgi:hypothetical protein
VQMGRMTGIWPARRLVLTGKARAPSAAIRCRDGIRAVQF